LIAEIAHPQDRAVLVTLSGASYLNMPKPVAPDCRPTASNIMRHPTKQPSLRPKASILIGFGDCIVLGSAPLLIAEIAHPQDRAVLVTLSGGTGLQTHGKQHNEASNKTAEPAAESINHIRHDELPLVLACSLLPVCSLDLGTA
jgi:hypothetical protein